MVIAVCLTVAVAATLYVGHHPVDSRLLWKDDFSGKAYAAPSATNWTTEEGYFGKPYSSLECMTNSRQNSHLTGTGDLVVVAQHYPVACGTAGTKDYTSARLTSHGLHSMRYGYLQIRARMAGGAGMWNALWLLGSDYPKVGWPRCGEIDLAEVTSRNSRGVYSTIHGPTTTGQPFSVAGERDLPGLSTSFHTYGLAWSPEGLTFTLDHVVYLRISKSEVEEEGEWVFDKKFDVVLNLAVGGDWPGSPSSDTPFPNAMVLDYVRVYSAVPTGV